MQDDKQKMKKSRSVESLFFSYGHDEYTELILNIKNYFQEKDYKILIDTEILYTGSDWEERLEDAIKENEKFIFFITKHSVRRPDSYCLNEIALALYLGKEIIPIMIEESRPPLSIIRTQYLDLKDITIKYDTDRLHKQLDNIIEVLNGKRKLDLEGQQAKLIHSLEPIDFRQDFKHHYNIIGREWIIEKVDEWLESINSSVMWLTADAGYGKSAIAAYLAQYHPKSIGIHFCSRDSSTKNKPINIIKTMAYHFQSQIDDYYDEIKDINFDSNDLSILIDNLILNPLEKITGNDDKHIFIIDGIDEAGENINGRITNPVSKMIRDKFTALPSNIRIVVTSRPEPYLRSDLSHLKPFELSMQEQENREDCKKFIMLKFSRHRSGEKPSEGFVESLLGRSGNNMLYLKSFFDAAQNSLISIDDLNAFPAGLDGMYKKYFEARFVSPDQYQNEYAPIFEMISTYEDHIERRLLASILNISRTELNRRVNAIGSFLKQEDEKLYYYHKSLGDWLISDSNIDYQIDLEEGRKRFDSFFERIDKQTFVQFSNNSKFNYHFSKYYLRQKDGILIYRDFIQSIDELSNQILLLIETASMYLEQKEHDECRLTLLLSESLTKEVQPIAQARYLIKIIELWIEENKYLGSKKEIKRILQSIDKYIDKFSKDMPDEIIKKYSDILIEYGSQAKSKKINKLLEKNQQRIEKRYKNRPEIISEYQSSTLVTELAINTAMFGGLGVGAAVVGAGLIPVFGQVFALGGVAYGLSKYFGNRKEGEAEKILNYEASLQILQKSLIKNPQKWIKEYLEMLKPLLELYLKLGEDKKASKLLQSSKKIVKELYDRNPNRWEDIYIKMNHLIELQINR